MSSPSVSNEKFAALQWTRDLSRVRVPEDWLGWRHQRRSVRFHSETTGLAHGSLFLEPTYRRGGRWVCCPGGLVPVYNVCRTTCRVDNVPVQYY
jgi:hypothetical protein